MTIKKYRVISKALTLCFFLNACGGNSDNSIAVNDNVTPNNPPATIEDNEPPNNPSVAVENNEPPNTPPVAVEDNEPPNNPPPVTVEDNEPPQPPPVTVEDNEPTTNPPGIEEDNEPPSNPPGITQLAITQGTARSAEMDTSSPIVDEASHGVRVYCGVSHFAFDDPVVHPNKPDAAHLHMFWGNTASNAFSNLDTLFSDGLSSCEGGLKNKSSYWMPAVFNELDEVVLPESVISYYKSFSSTPSFDRNSIMPIPNGLEMLTTKQVKNSGPWNFSIESTFDNGKESISMRLLFPNCLSVNQDGTPILKSANNISHLAFADASGNTSGDCPTSHPYRMPQLSYNLLFAIPMNSGWYLASDHNVAMQGQSLHADYIAAWDETTMNRIVQCNRELRKECEFVSYENGNTLFRDQLSERFLSPDGAKIYSDSTSLAPDVDRTPFGNQLKKHR